MNPSSVKIVDHVPAVEAIKRLDEEDLLFLNRLIVERLKLISQARATTLMTRFTKGDRVGFQAPDGRMLEGIVLRLNKKTVTVATDDGHQWNVAPSLLRLVQSAGDGQWPGSATQKISRKRSGKCGGWPDVSQK